MNNIVLENKNFSLTLSEDGYALSLLHKKSGRELLSGDPHGLAMDFPPVSELRFLQLAIKNGLEVVLPSRLVLFLTKNKSKYSKKNKIKYSLSTIRKNV